MTKARDIADLNVTILDSVESGATADQSNAEIRAAVEAATDSNVFTDADHTKLDGINQGVASTDSPTFAALTSTGEITANGGIALGDNDKATFGTGDDLQIYHDGSNSYITDTGTGNLYVRASNELALTSAAGEAFFLGIADGSSYLYHNGGVKLNTTSTGIDVTGTATMDGLSASASTADYIASITNSNGSDAGKGLFVSTRWNTATNSVAKFVFSIKFITQCCCSLTIVLYAALVVLFLTA